MSNPTDIQNPTKTRDCLNSNPVIRDGTSQRQRLMDALLPGYVEVDERSMQDLTEYVYKLAEEFSYYKSDHTTNSNWQPFFDLAEGNWNDFDIEIFTKQLKKTQQADPHIALFLAFLYMFKLAQDDLNTLTKRHLDFYYRQVLKLKEQSLVPDQIAVIFELAKNVDAYQVKKGTEVKAGKDAIGVERIYKVIEDTAVNKAKVVDIRSVFVNHDNVYSGLVPNPANNHRIYASEIANSGDGIGGDIENESKSWRTFGAPDFPPSSIVADRPFAKLGFAVSSPILHLAEGERTITFTLTLAANLNTVLSNDVFEVFLSGEKDWIKVDTSDTQVTVANKIITITAVLHSEADPVLAFNSEKLTEPYVTKWPVAEIRLNQQKTGSPFVFKKLKNLKIDSAKIHVGVKGVKNLVIQNDEAVLDPSKPFFPFGSRPVIGSNFMLGSWEVFQKNLSNLSIHFQWKGLPDGKSFGTYYHSYKDYSPSNDDFKVRLSILDDRDWTQLVNSTALLTDENGTAISNAKTFPFGEDIVNQIKITDTAALSSVDRDPNILTFESLDTNSQRGFLRMTLKNIDFGHSKYAKSFAEQAMKASTLAQKTDVSESGSGTILFGQINDTVLGNHASLFELDTTNNSTKLPNEPYTPKWENIHLSYESEVTLELSNHSAKQDDGFFHVHPFGVAQIDEKKFENTLLPTYNDEGNLYIGFEDLTPAATLSVLFQVAEGSANPDLSKQKIKWEYLSNNKWETLDPTHNILRDGTNGLLTSGIITYDFPKKISKTNTLLPKDKYWIRAGVQQQSGAISDLIDIVAQAVAVEFENKDNDPLHLREALPAGSAKKLLRSNASIKKIDQPYNSNGGKMPESSSSFHTRISERLRHKHRSITMWDYERTALLQFPAIYKAKAVNHTRYNGALTDYSELAPGHVTVVTVADVKNKNAVDPLRPKTPLDTLTKIYDYLKKIAPPCVTLHVHNPVFEEIKVCFDVKFNSGVDRGLSEQRLNRELKDFLSPWSSSCARDISFGGQIYKSSLINFVDERPYVDFVTCFKMFHIVPNDPENNPTEDVDFIESTTAISILGSADAHIVNSLEPEVEGCDCPDNIIPSKDKILSTQSCS